MKLQLIVIFGLLNYALTDDVNTTDTEEKSDDNINNDQELLNLFRDIKQGLNHLQQNSHEESEKRFQFSQKISEMDKHVEVVKGGHGQFEMPQPMIEPIMQPFEMPQQENCMIRVNTTCYWAEIHIKEDINFAKASTICGDRNSDIGQIPDYYAYQQITKYIQTLIPAKQSRISVLIALRVDQESREVFPPSFYTKWRPSFPKSGYGYTDTTFVYVVVGNNPNDPDLGMGNGHHDWDYQGVLCRVPARRRFYSQPTLELEHLDSFYGAENCDIRLNSICYWAEVHSNGEVNYRKAEQICSERGSIVAQISDPHSYQQIMSYLRTQIPITKTTSMVWFDLRVKPTTAEVFPTNQYTRWAAGSPRKGYGYGEATYTFLNVEIFINGAGQGMMNYDYPRLLNGVVCQQKTSKVSTMNKVKTDNCDIKIDTTCYWAELHSMSDVNYKRANQICNERNSVVGRIPDVSHYKQIMSYLRTKIPTPTTESLVWFDLRVKHTTGEVFPTNYYTRWASGAPRTGYGYGEATYSFLNVEIFVDTDGQGMFNIDYHKNLYGVLCQQEDVPVVQQPTPQNAEQICDGGIMIDRICYWATVYDKAVVNYNKATQICTEGNSRIAHVPNKLTYDHMMSYLRTKIHDAQTTASAWIDLKVEPETGRVEPSNSYTRWPSSFPINQYNTKEDRNVYLFAEVFLEDPGQGMKNAHFSDSVKGVLCQKNL
ncbi:uncharacterized protein LOC144430564 isoform X3 [Styela clava]